MNENSIGNIKIIFYIVEILSFGGVKAQKLKNLLWASSERLSVPFPHTVGYIWENHKIDVGAEHLNFSPYYF